MTDYTRKERDAINDAWRALDHLCHTYDMKAAHRLAEALKYERRQRSSALAAKACLISSWAVGAAVGYETADLYDLSDGCATAAAMGAHMARQRREEVREVLALVCTAGAAQQSSIDRRLANIWQRSA